MKWTSVTLRMVTDLDVAATRLWLTSAHIITRERVNFVYDADISGFFDNVNHGKLIELLGHRIEDARMLRLITSFSSQA